MSKETVNHILEKGSELIFKNGYHSVGLQKILNEANIPKGSFYYYFKSKEDFGLKVIELYSKNTVAFLKSFLENKDLAPKERILNLFETMKLLYKEQEFSKGCLLGNCSIELSAQKQSFADTMQEEFQKLQGIFSNTIREGQNSGNINTNMSAEEYADFIINSWEGALVRMKSTKNNQSMDLLLNVLKQLI